MGGPGPPVPTPVMRSSLLTNYRCFYSLYGQIGLSHDKTKFPDRKFPGFPGLVKKVSLQMATFNMTHRQYFHVIFHVLKCVIVKNGDHFNDKSRKSK